MALYESILYLLLGSVIIASFFAGQLIGMHAAINTGVDCDKFQSVDSSLASSGSVGEDKIIDILVTKRVEEGKYYKLICLFTEAYKHPFSQN